MTTPASFIIVHVTWNHEKSVRDYLDPIEDSIHSFRHAHKGVKPTISSASDTVDGYQSETFSLKITNPTIVDILSDEIITAIQSIGINKGFSFRIAKSIPFEHGVEIFERRILPRRKTRWAIAAELCGKPNPNPVIVTFPKKIKYLATCAEKYYLVGGNDLFSVFDQKWVIDKFLSSLSEQERTELSNVYNRLVDKEDHKWIMDWVLQGSEETDVSPDKEKAIYFLAFLDRLRERGVFGEYQVSEEFELVDWGRIN